MQAKVELQNFSVDWGGETGLPGIVTSIDIQKRHGAFQKLAAVPFLVSSRRSVYRFQDPLEISS